MKERKEMGEDIDENDFFLWVAENYPHVIEEYKTERR